MFFATLSISLTFAGIEIGELAMNLKTFAVVKKIFAWFNVWMSNVFLVLTAIRLSGSAPSWKHFLH
jgi:hypothetical protein